MEQDKDVMFKVTPKAKVIASSLVNSEVFTPKDGSAPSKPKFNITVELDAASAEKLIAELQPVLDAKIAKENENSPKVITAKPLSIQKIKRKDESGKYVETGTYRMFMSRAATPFEGKEAKSATIEAASDMDIAGKELGAGSVVSVKYMVKYKTVGDQRCLKFIPLAVRVYSYEAPVERTEVEWPE